MSSFGPLAAFLPSLPLDFVDAVCQTTQLGLTHIDVAAQIERPLAHLEALADSGALVQCAVLGRDLPPGHGLEIADVTVRRKTLDLLKQQLTDAAQLGANCTYIIPGSDPSATALAYFAEGCALLAEYAAQRMLRLCVEPIPGRALATAGATLAWLESLAHPNLYLLLDVGHCLISGEDVGACVRRAGSRLGYVHLDDNDGTNDLHWPLLMGQLTQRDLEELANALREIGYRRGLALELKPGHEDATAALNASKEIAERFLQG
jgi:sugar phosphate isomerase/epimerase